MSLSSRGLLLLGSVALLAAAGCSGASSSSSSPHSLRYFHTGLSEPGQGLPQFSIVGYVDDQPFVKYESDGRKMLPQVPWMEEFGKEDPQYWEGQSQRAQGAEPVFRGNLGTLRERFNQQNSTGLHTLQFMVCCEVGPDGRLRRGHYQFAYEGEDFLAFDRETVRWTAAVQQAENSRQKLDRQQDISQRVKDYLEGECVEWLRRYLDYGKEALQRTEAPMMRVSRKKGYDGQETLFCQLYGFYPKEIEVTWMKDGEDQKPETFTGGVVPNSDGTYHTWLSIEVDPKEKDRYWCHVEHDSLPEPLDLAWEEPAPNWGLILSIVGVNLLAAAILGVLIAFRRKRKEKGYEAAPTSDLGHLLGIVVLILLAAAILVGVFAFRTSKLGLILGSVVLILLAAAILVVVFAFRRKLLKINEAAPRKLLKSDEEASTSHLDLILGIVGLNLLVVSILVGVIAFRRIQLKSYEAASVSVLGLILGIVGLILSVVAIFAFRRKLLKSYEAASEKQPPECDAEPLPKNRPLEGGAEALPKNQPLEGGAEALPKNRTLEGSVEEPPKNQTLEGGAEALPKNQTLEGGVEALPKNQTLEGGAEALPKNQTLEGGVEALPKNQTLEGGVEAPPMKHPLEQ